MKTMKKNRTEWGYYKLSYRERQTVLAALCYWRREGLMADPIAELDIAADGGKIRRPLDDNEIVKLCMDIEEGDRNVTPMPDALCSGPLTSAQDADLLNQAAPYAEALGIKEEGIQDHRRAQILKHRNHTLRLNSTGVWCRTCRELLIEDADAWPKKAGANG